MQASPTDTPLATAARPQRRSRVQLVLGLAGGVLVTLFAVLNLDRVKVNWIIGSWSTPLIVVIVVCLLVGVLLDRATIALMRRNRRRAQAPSR